MKVLIRKGKKEDLPHVLALIHELALFEKAPDAITNTVEAMERDGFGEDPIYGLLVAEVEGKIVGISVFFVKYSTWCGKGLYLDDLVITEKYRRQGIGRKLFSAFMEEAKAIGAKQVHWQVLDWNTPALEFYKKLGSTVEPEWWDCKMLESQIKNYKA